MADPRGPETGQGAKGGHGARPRPQTLELSATDVSPKSAAPAQDAKPAGGAAEKPDSTVAAKPADASPTAAAAKPVDPAKPSGTSKTPDQPTANPAAAKPDVAASAAKAEQPKAAPAPEPAKSEPAKSEPGKPEATKPDTAKTEAAKTAASGPDAARSDASASKPAAGPATTQRVSETTASPAPAPRGGVGALGVAAAALGGAAIAVLVIALFGRELMGLGSNDAARMNAAEAKLDAVARDVAALRTGVAGAAQASDMGAIDGRLSEVAKALEATNGRVGGVQGDLQTLSAKMSEPAAPDPAIAALAGRVEGLELRLQQSPTAEALATLAGRIEGVEARLADLPTKQAVAEVSANVTAMGRKIDGVAGPLSARVDAVGAAVRALPKGDPAARLVVALGALDGALAAGRPFAAELEAVKSASGGNAELAPLDPYAAKGLPTREALGAELSATIGGLPPVRTAPAGSVFERFVANAGDVVKITPKDAASGSDPAAIRAQVAAAGAAGDVEGALAARGKLDEAARAATDQWAETATALVSAGNALRAARTAALARLTAND